MNVHPSRCHVRAPTAAATEKTTQKAFLTPGASLSLPLFCHMVEANRLLHRDYLRLSVAAQRLGTTCTSTVDAARQDSRYQDSPQLMDQ